MARKLQRVVAVSAASTRHKRAASNSTPLNAEKSSSKKQKATPTRSQYFKRSKDYAEPVEDEGLDSEESSSPDGEDSAFESEAESASSGGDDDDEYESEAEAKPKSAKKTKASSTAKLSAAIRPKEDDLLRPGVKTGLGPGTEVVIKKPKARHAGKTAYRDETIHPNTILFLADLKANNERQWLKSECDLSPSEFVRLGPTFSAVLLELQHDCQLHCAVLCYNGPCTTSNTHGDQGVAPTCIALSGCGTEPTGPVTGTTHKAVPKKRVHNTRCLQLFGRCWTCIRSIRVICRLLILQCRPTHHELAFSLPG